MPNPFDLRGPEFLVFYLLLGLLVTAVAWLLLVRAEPAAGTMGPLTDYLRIAYLRGGADEALRVATVALIDRGLITIDDDRMTAAANVPAGLHPTEQRLLESCKDSIRARAVLADTRLKLTVTTECESSLVRAGLLPDSTIKSARRKIAVQAASFLVLVALVKILIAFSRGRSNVGFLILLCVGFGVALYFLANPFRTTAGDMMLADLRELFEPLQQRTAPITGSRGDSDLALLAAVFGLTALPAGHVGLTERLFAKREAARSRGARMDRPADPRVDRPADRPADRRAVADAEAAVEDVEVDPRSSRINVAPVPCGIDSRWARASGSRRSHPGGKVPGVAARTTGASPTGARDSGRDTRGVARPCIDHAS